MERPDLTTESGRLAAIRVLNARLPKKRLIAQGLIRSTEGDVLLCQLTYKQAHDLPGGIVDPDESPAMAVLREIEEELGLVLEAHALRAVNWLPPYRGWDDALLCLFDLGVHDRSLVEHPDLERREIRSVRWARPEEIPDLVAPYTARMIAAALAETPGTLYLEDGSPLDLVGGS